MTNDQALAVVITIVLVNFVLPQLLLLGDGFVQATTVKLRGLHVKDPRRTARLAFNALLTAACVFARRLIRGRAAP